MTSLLLIISFLLHIVLFWAIMQLFQQLQTLKQKQTEEKEAIESILFLFLDEMKEENKQLAKALKQSKTSLNNQHIEKIQRRTSQEESPAYSLDKLIEEKEKAWPVNVEIEAEKKDIVETSISAQVFQLHQSGASIEEIAKKLNKGKTEVELILKLQRK